MSTDTKTLHLTADDLSLIHSALHNLGKGMQAIKDAGRGVDSHVQIKAAAMAAEIEALQAKIIKETSPDIADHSRDYVMTGDRLTVEHVDGFLAKAASAPLAAERCICQQVFKSTGGGRQEARIKNKRCVVHGRPNHLKVV